MSRRRDRAVLAAAFVIILAAASSSAHAIQSGGWGHAARLGLSWYRLSENPYRDYRHYSRNHDPRYPPYRSNSIRRHHGLGNGGYSGGSVRRFHGPDHTDYPSTYAYRAYRGYLQHYRYEEYEQWVAPPTAPPQPPPPPAYQYDQERPVPDNSPRFVLVNWRWR